MKYFIVMLAFFAMPLLAQEVPPDMPPGAVVQYFNVHSGTGFFVNREYLITNAHVVHECGHVTISGGAVSAQEAEVVAMDTEHDLALIRSASEPTEFAPLRLDIDSLKIGDNVMVIGYPGQKGYQGVYSVATAQVQQMDVNSVGQPWRFYITDVIQHGNSGGPVLDDSGNVIGVAEGMMQLKTMNAETHEKISETRLGMVITLRALQHFLEDHGVFAQWTGSGLLMFSNNTLEDNAKKFIVNVQCRVPTYGPPPFGEQPADEPLPEVQR